MHLAAFRASLSDDAPPAGSTPALRVLWLERRGDWHAAHEIAQDLPDPEGAWLHGYLHRREGDDANAGYWYRRARQPVPEVDLDEEWNAMVAHFLSRRPGTPQV